MVFISETSISYIHLERSGNIRLWCQVSMCESVFVFGKKWDEPYDHMERFIEPVDCRDGLQQPPTLSNECKKESI